MKIHNTLPLLLSCLEKWEKIPTEKKFIEEYAVPMEQSVGNFFEDFYSALLELDWDQYRAHALKIDPKHEEVRLKKHMRDIERLFEVPLSGEVVLFGSFETMDGFARFDWGNHKVFLGVDESFDDGQYIDILTTHELF